MTFYHLYVQLRYMFFMQILYVCTMVILKFLNLSIFTIVQTIEIPCFEAKNLQKSSFETKKYLFWAQIAIYNRFLPLIPLKTVLRASKCHFWNVEKKWSKITFSMVKTLIFIIYSNGQNQHSWWQFQWKADKQYVESG